MVGTIICEVGTIMCDIGTINVRFYLLEVRFTHEYCRITLLKIGFNNYFLYISIINTIQYKLLLNCTGNKSFYVVILE